MSYTKTQPRPLKKTYTFLAHDDRQLKMCRIVRDPVAARARPPSPAAVIDGSQCIERSQVSDMRGPAAAANESAKATRDRCGKTIPKISTRFGECRRATWRDLLSARRAARCRLSRTWRPCSDRSAFRSPKSVRRGGEQNATVPPNPPSPRTRHKPNCTRPFLALVRRWRAPASRRDAESAPRTWPLSFRTQPAALRAVVLSNVGR